MMLMTNSHDQQLQRDERGIVSIIVTAIIVVLLTLITVGFAKIIGREQRQTLDRQLSTQAFYAAETGVNDAVAALTTTDPLLRLTENKEDCEADGSLPSFATGSNQLDGTQGVEYSCLLIDQAPYTLEYSSVSTDASAYVPINGVAADGVTPATITKIRISWQDEQGLTGFSPSFPSFLTVGAWTSNTGVLRTALTNVSGTLDRTTLVNNTFTTFLYPRPGGAGTAGSTSYTSTRAEQGRIIAGNCNSANNNIDFPKYCNVDITGLSQFSYFLRLKSIYANSAVTITAFDASNTQLRLARAQALVDSTGKANDVLRRIQVRVPARDDYSYPEAVIDSADSVCKRLSVGPPDIATADPFDAACDLP